MADKSGKEVFLEKEIENFRKEINCLNEKIKESKQSIDEMRTKIDSNIEELKKVRDNKIETNLTTSNRLGEVIKVASYMDLYLEYIKKQRIEIVEDNYPRNSVGELLVYLLSTNIKLGRFTINSIQIDGVKYDDYNDIPNYILINSKVKKYYKIDNDTMVIDIEKGD